MGYNFCWLDTGTKERNDGAKLIYHISKDFENDPFCGVAKRARNILYSGDVIPLETFEASVGTGFVCKRCEKKLRKIIAHGD